MLLASQLAYHSLFKMSSCQLFTSTEALSRSRHYTHSLIRPTHIARDTTIMFALGHPLFKQLLVLDKIIRSKSFLSFARELSSLVSVIHKHINRYKILTNALSSSVNTISESFLLNCSCLQESPRLIIRHTKHIEN